ncbi:flagellar biosynthesis regulator FlaF [Methylobacterium sp. C25]|uniref:flagellar biosynthesis regulator FlaF n=1 Tax=Methylobacterium sp. C25 TaxID=2721622 RepID=UPI001F3233A4|nr:flagellar biosynthesis regulator FlaF [Methylobacterium sp. C25]MCE4222420.1 flagellar biosynthesis regulator FlaF [Methylobacterium sp. C25]
MMQGANAYARVARSALTPREAEAAVLLKAAGRLQAFTTGEVMGSAALNEALMFNQRVWTILAGAVADPANPLPDDIRQNVTNIAVFVFRTIIDAMIEPAAHKLEALVSLNNHLAAGLQGSPTPSAA